MNLEQTVKLLEETKTLFLRKKLEPAMQKAKQALSISIEENDVEKTVASNILIGKIYNSQGRYKGDTKNYANALAHLKNAGKQLNGNVNNNIAYNLALGDVYRNTKELELSEIHFSEAFVISHNNKNTEGIIRSMICQGELFILRNEFEEAMAITNECEQYLKAVETPLLKADVYNLLCKIHVKRQEYNKTLDYSTEALEISKKHQDAEKELTALNNLAIYYGFKLDYHSAIELLFDSIEKSEAIGFDRQTAQNLVNIGTIYAQLFNYKDAIIKYETVLQQYGNVLEDTNKAILYNNIGTIHLIQKNNADAEAYFQKSLELAEQINYQEMIALSLSHLSRVKFEEKDFEVSEVYANRADELNKGLGMVNSKAINLVNFGNISYHKGDSEKAITYLKECIEVAKALKDERSEIDAYQLLSNLHESNGNFQQAYKYQKLYAEQQSGFLLKQRNSQILDQEIRFATKEKQQQIDNLQKENELQALLLKQQEELKQKNSQLTQANNELRQFAYVTSHDLKEPLRMIKAYTQLIEKKLKDQADEDTKEFFGFVTDGATRMDQLLDDLLKYAIIGRDEQKLKPIALQNTIEICEGNLRLLIEDTQTTLEYNNLPTVNGIPALLSQLFQNLISNAIKFRKKNVRPHIVISGKETEDSYVVQIKDNGIGIDPDYKNQIFVIFRRLHARETYEGTGIGLAICHKIMQRLGGSIQVESELGKGATFILNFPK